MKEKDLSISIGISRDQLKEIRATAKEGIHYKRLESKKPKHLWEIEWTQEGVSFVQSVIGLNPTETEVAPPEEKRGTVQAKHKNPRILSVIIDGKSNMVLCRDSSKFGIGMPVDIRWDGTRWVVSRHPRFDGKY